VVGAPEFPAESSVLDVHTLLVVAALVGILVLYPYKSLILRGKELTAQIGVCISHWLFCLRPDLVHSVDVEVFARRSRVLLALVASQTLLRVGVGLMRDRMDCWIFGGKFKLFGGGFG
jgi:hypothetical protein